MGVRLSYLSPHGREWRLIGPEHDGVWVVDGGITGLVGSGEDSASTLPGVPGHRVEAVEVPPVDGALTVRAGDGAGGVPETFSRFRSDWSFRVPGRLVLSGDDGAGPVWARARLAGPIAAPAHHPAELRGLVFEVPVRLDDGLWWETISSDTDSVTVTNTGDVFVRPRVEWNGPGGRLIMPSGAAVTLPAVDSPRVLVLDNSRSNVVRDPDGTVDTGLWPSMVADLLPEGVPPGEARTYWIPGGATLHWDIGHLDPWGVTW